MSRDLELDPKVGPSGRTGLFKGYIWSMKYVGNPNLGPTSGSDPESLDSCRLSGELRNHVWLGDSPDRTRLDPELLLWRGLESSRLLYRRLYNNGRGLYR